jgi:hypothetical protein
VIGQDAKPDWSENRIGQTVILCLRSYYANHLSIRALLELTGPPGEKCGLVLNLSRAVHQCVDISLHIINPATIYIAFRASNIRWIKAQCAVNGRSIGKYCNTEPAHA